MLTTDELRCIADLDCPLYLAKASEVPAAFIPTTENVYGCHHPDLDLILRPWLESQGQWDGPGVAIYVDDKRIRQAANEVKMEFQFQLDDYLDAVCVHHVDGVALHELGHALERQPEALASREGRLKQSEQIYSAFCISGSASEAAPFHHHHARWARTTLHLAYRAKHIFDVHIPLVRCCNTAQYSLSPIATYALALGDEPQQMASVCFSQIRDTQPPAAFIDLWHRDVRDFFLTQQQPTEDMTRAIVASLNIFDR